ncbi:MAG: hypothetical protein JZU65_05695 [Chlorobium sp.]|nr:hypothetical protein [Chlorobium sp.]
MVNFKTSLKDQKPSLTDTLITTTNIFVKPNRLYKWSYLQSIILFSIGAVFGMLILVTVKACDNEPQTVIQNCSYCHNKKMAFTIHFKNKGSRSPEEMADAVLKTKNPRLLAAIAVVESDGNSHIRNRGYKKQHDGAFQVNPAHWGKVPHDAEGQALQAEDILEELVGTKKNIRVALNHYGGDTRGNYAKAILKELQEVPKL